MTLGRVLSELIKDNPRIVILPTKTLKIGVPIDVDGIKLATLDGEKVLVLTI